MKYAKQNKDLVISQKTINEVEKVKETETFIVTDEMVRALLAIKNASSAYSSVHRDIYKMIEEAQRGYSIPTSLYSMGRYDSLEDWSKAMNELSSFSNYKRQMEELSASMNPFARLQMNETIQANSSESTKEQE